MYSATHRDRREKGGERAEQMITLYRRSLFWLMVHVWCVFLNLPLPSTNPPPISIFIFSPFVVTNSGLFYSLQPHNILDYENWFFFFFCVFNLVVDIWMWNNKCQCGTHRRPWLPIPVRLPTNTLIHLPFFLLLVFVRSNKMTYWVWKGWVEMCSMSRVIYEILGSKINQLKDKKNKKINRILGFRGN